jgi:UDP-N-acetylglucosamine 3-dehydrogenase
MSELSVGVVGLGLGRHHVAAYAQSELVGRLVLCDVDPERLAEMQGEIGADATYTDVAEMLANEALDAVSIVTPDHLHRPHAEQCLESGCHVLLTKPLATNLNDARAIVHAAEAAGRELMVAHERRYRKRYLKIKELLTTGQMGQIIHLRIDAIADKRRQFERSPWYASAQAGRTALVGTGIHEVDLLRFLIDKPIGSAFAYSNRLGGLAFPADKTTAAVYQFDGGTIGQVTVTYEAHRPPGGPPLTTFCLVATKGTIVGDRYSLDSTGEWQGLPSDEQGIIVGTAGCVGAFLDAIVHGHAVPISGRDAFASLAACVAADQSAASGQPMVPATADF